jgi:predicted permease
MSIRWTKTLRLRFRSLLRRDRVEQELDDEIRFHLDHLIDEYAASGMPREEARYAALREMGGIDQRKEECRDARGVRLFDNLRQDVAYAVRSLRKSPGFSAVAILSLALGIGANTTIFTFVNAVLLRPLPYPDSDRIVVLRERRLTSDGTVNVHPFNFLQWQARARSFEALALVQTPPLTVMGSSGAEQIARVQTTPEFFRVFGVSPFLGRTFSEEDGRPGPHPVVILGHAFWQRWFGGDLNVLGRQLAIRDGWLTVVGVAPPGIRIGSMEPEAYTPLSIDPVNPASIGSRSFQCYGRLKPDLTVDAARAEIDVIASALEREYPLDRGMGVFLSTLHDYLVRDVRPALRLLMGVVATVLIIACTNLAALLLARGMSRRAEFAVRTSLGASRGRLIRQLVTESLVLAFLSGAAGLVVAYFAIEALVRLTAAGSLSTSVMAPVRLDAACLAFTALLSTATALAFGLMPAWRSARTDPHAVMRQQSRSATIDRHHHRIRGLLVGGEVALAVVLLVGAGLLLRTFSSLVNVDIGFQPANTLTVGLFLPIRSPEARIEALERILERVEVLPGVQAAGTIQFLPLSGANCGTRFRHYGAPTGSASSGLSTECSLVSRGYFAAMGIPLLDGRVFDGQDRRTSSRVVIVNQTFARRYFPDGRALGRRLLVDWSDQASAEIVGVVGDVRHNGLNSEAAPTVFLLHAQTPGFITNLVVRTTVEPALQAAAVRRAIQEVDPTQGVTIGKTMEQYVGEALARPRLYATLVACFAVIAVTLAVIGLYGLIAYIVTQRTHEIGIRLALGAARSHVFHDLFRQGALLVLIGLGIGVLAAAGLRGVVSTLLFGVAPGDPASYVIAAIGFAAVALVAVALPARRGSRIEPVTALRCE